MRRHQLMVFAGILLTASLFGTGCARLKKAPAAPQGGQAGGVVGDVPGGGGAGSEIGVGDRHLFTGEGDREQFRAQTVYFDFDSARVRPSEVGKLEAVASGAKGQSIVIEGHADERGTPEYNRALAERRALACREELIRLGVPANSLSTISFGEERPADPGHDEAAWSQNRRCEFVVVGQ